ncbi:tetratricopeptide repeat protein [Aureisphaera galaxeae]|uniref:tetratricopeptide repeat protein n=1 Tax=Aureisphaera galaxeae TaxID=1538023 RepID=UPI002350A91A|nr:tetratricopeptide repeat protein [Aureisphaera galaxeae]MDC8002433.1 tetratricopeptide repeat protein [Aureisphaera galaxeae]
MSQVELQRGIQLFELGRYEEAIPYFTKDLNSWNSKFYLAHCYFLTSNNKKAKSLVDELLAETPDHPDIFFLRSKIAHNEDRYKDALADIDEAINFHPYAADYFGMKASILLQMKKYEEGLLFANEGLNIEPTNRFCLNVRAQLLTKLEKIPEANQTIEDILLENPQDVYSHANVGWVELEKNNIDKALNHFKEALSIDPNFEYAREGMSTALKAKNFIYRQYLKYAFWISKKSSGNQWAFIIGLYLVYRFSYKFLSDAGLSYLAIPLVIAYLLFALGSWMMEPLSNCILSFNTYGKYLLNKDEKLSGYTFGALVALGLVSIALFYGLQIDYFLSLSVACFSALIPLPRAFIQYSKGGRDLGFITGILILGVGAMGFLVMESAYTVSLVAFIIMVIYTWVSNLFK